jgi:acetyltransferase-like isoleucine patch superfamily enzyme
MTTADVLAETREILSYKVGSWAAVHLFRVTDKSTWVHWSVKYRMPSQIKVDSYCELRRGVLLDARSRITPSIIIGNHCRIKEYASLLAYGGRIELKDNVLVGPGTCMYGHGGISIGSYSMLGGGITLSSANYACNLSSAPFQRQGYVLRPVKISSNVWIGNNSTILGVSIPENVIVGAGSVVTHDLESGFVYAGNPAKKIKPISVKGPEKVRYRDWRSFAER